MHLFSHLSNKNSSFNDKSGVSKHFLQAYLCQESLLTQTIYSKDSHESPSQKVTTKINPLLQALSLKKITGGLLKGRGAINDNILTDKKPMTFQETHVLTWAANYGLNDLVELIIQEKNYQVAHCHYATQLKENLDIRYIIEQATQDQRYADVLVQLN